MNQKRRRLRSSDSFLARLRGVFRVFNKRKENSVHFGRFLAPVKRTEPVPNRTIKRRLTISNADIKKEFANVLTVTYQIGTFFLLLVLYVSARVLVRASRLKYVPRGIKVLQPPLLAFYTRATKFLDGKGASSISRIDLIELSIKNMKAKKTRTIVTVGGMMIGIGVIVFLVSIGYGLQELVIHRVARLEELRQADVTPQAGGKVKITDKTLADFDDIAAVETSLPLIAVVGRVSYQNSISDMAVYGVTADYLKQSAIKPIKGKIFESNNLVSVVSRMKGVVANMEKAVFGEKIQNVNFSIEPSSLIRVRKSPTVNAQIIGYTKRVEGISSGEEFWGGSYESGDAAGRASETESGESLGKWVKAPVLLWKKEECDPQIQGDCEIGGYVVMRDEENRQVQSVGYFAEINTEVIGVNIKRSQVLGVTSDDVEGEEARVDTSVEWVEIASEAGVIALPETRTIELAGSAQKQAVVNRAMIKVLGINESEAVGKKFNVSFVVVGELLEEAKEKIESATAEYTIVGVTPEEQTPVFYVPFIDLRGLGITNYSQVKLVVKDKAELFKTRRQVEAMGYITRSVTDTVDQINSLFGTLRVVLLLLGMVALSVAALGMFNTLTVSLLERTREVGLMKAMGMKSSEVQELFLTESMIMGFFGGILGITFGATLGKLLSVGLSFFAVFKGIGFINISHIPIFFTLAIILLSFLVGIGTGIYPAQRATKISALNALRYE